MAYDFKKLREMLEWQYHSKCHYDGSSINTPGLVDWAKSLDFQLKWEETRLKTLSVSKTASTNQIISKNYMHISYGTLKNSNEPNNQNKELK